MPPVPASPRQAFVRIALIRFAILFGVVLFGAVAWWMRSGPSATPAPQPGFFAQVGLLPAIIVGGALVATVALRMAWGRVRESGRRRALSIVALAPGEAAAIFGAVGYFLAGEPRWFLFGVLVLLAAFVMFPLRELREGR